MKQGINRGEVGRKKRGEGLARINEAGGGKRRRRSGLNASLTRHACQRRESGSEIERERERDGRH